MSLTPSYDQLHQLSLAQFFDFSDDAPAALQSEQDRRNGLYSFLTGIDLSENAAQNISQEQFNNALATVKFKKRATEDYDDVLSAMEQQTNWARRLTNQVLKLI